jgi:protein-S-isoprenylcysteine O-methyltransferase Ste14
MSNFLYALPMISVVLLASARGLEIFTQKQGRVRGPVRENLTFWLFILTGAVVAGGSILEYLFLRDWFSWGVFAAGWVLGIISFWIRNSAIAALGRFWSLHVEIRENHEFVKSGPFRFVRHPVYFSMILELLAFALVCCAWMVVLIIPIIFVPVLLMRVRLEEAALMEKFGPAYEEYRRTTPAIFPRPW